MESAEESGLVFRSWHLYRQSKTVVDEFKAYGADHVCELSPIFGTTLDFADDELSLWFEDSPCFFDKLQIVCAHQRKAKYDNTHAFFRQWQMRTISYLDEWFCAD